MAAIRNALIVGGGLAGLTAAASLARAGVNCDVIDIADGPAGAAITLLNRAIDALNEIGALDGCLAQGKITDAEELFTNFDAAGNRLPAPPMPKPPESDLPQGILIYRPDLYQVLRKAAEDAGANVRIGLSIESLVQSADGVEVTLTDGQTRTYDLVVGADGIRSKTRSLILTGEESVEPTYSGVTMFRAVVGGVPDLGPTGHFHAKDLCVIRRMADGRIYFATGREYAERPTFDAQSARETVRDIFSAFSAPLLCAVASKLTADVKLIVNDYDWLLVKNPWYRGRVVLIGDAAHATTAHLASGGGMAVEDGIVLGQEIGKAATCEEALAAFMARRFDRARFVVEARVQLDQMTQQKVSPTEQSKVRRQAMATLSVPY